MRKSPLSCETHERAPAGEDLSIEKFLILDEFRRAINSVPLDSSHFTSSFEAAP